METGKVRFWNFWWTLTVISAVFTAVVLVLEALGVFRDIGLVLSGLGLLLTLISGLTASTRSSLTEFRREVAPRLDRIDTRLGDMTDRLERIVRLLEERLPRPAA